ncbi:N-acetylmuramoyl-L-alanine amidase [Ureibacillus chungkukjangi]|uniref:N-acetylmuramoyl-L-alanine amidase n=1 Tax=Ureibacillus chungkukjangi TaxID=1202712 RepID=A0A318TUP2_9BACL|nr:N-acetylmuramoyl-L-alanine amidase [Ureibacillus chungkukjangi]PYF07587.1 N-acetylmuramoyl-L-alanine amidase [Ureibacillus chungkukjangi]
MTKRKIVCMLLALCLAIPMFGTQTTSAAPVFADVPSTHEAYEAINYVKNAGLAGGYNEGGQLLFKPSHLVTRSQATIMLLNALGVEKIKSTKSSYSDVISGSGLSEFVETATKMNLLVEKSTDRKFYPYLAVSLKDASLIISKAYNLDVEKYSTYSLPFKGISASDPYYKYISTLYHLGVIDDSFAQLSNKNVNRGQFSILIARAAQKFEPPVQGISAPEDAKVIGKVNITVDNLNVRSSATSSISTNIVGKVNKGTTFNVYEDSNGWLKVSYDGVFAYVSKQYAQYITGEVSKPETPKPPDTITTGTVGKATVNGLQVRSGAGTNFSSIGVLNKGDEVAVQSISNYWAKVSFNNKEGYVHKSYLKLLNQSGSAVKNRIIVIDPGHGGKDPGAIAESATEKAIVLKVANQVKQKLEANGAKVVMTRSGDTYPSLQDRVKIADNNYGEVFVSIHVNSASSSSAKGTETYYSVSSGDMFEEDIKLATYINNQIVNNAKMTNRGVKKEAFYVINNMIIPSVLVELGFISNNEDRAKLVNDQYVSIFADSIYKGIVEYYNK